MSRKLSKKQKENRAIEAIIAATLRGWDDEAWRLLFRKLDAEAALRKKLRELEPMDLLKSYP